MNPPDDNRRINIETDDPDNISVYRYAKGGFIFVAGREAGQGPNGSVVFSLDDSLSVALGIIHLSQGHEQVERVRDCSACNALEDIIRRVT